MPKGRKGFQKGHPRFTKHKFPKGNVPWNKGLKGFNAGDKHSNWKGGRRRNKGYIIVYQPDHPFATSHKTVLEHRLVMEGNIGRYLKPSEQIHHINGIKDDNRIENLVLIHSNLEHKEYHSKLKNIYLYKAI